MATAGTSSGTTVRLPGVTAEFHRPDHYLPTRDDLAGAVATVRGLLPSPQMGLWLGGLGAMAALSVLEWPVAAAIGASTVVVGHTAGSRAAGSSGGASSTSSAPSSSGTSSSSGAQSASGTSSASSAPSTGGARLAGGARSPGGA